MRKSEAEFWALTPVKFNWLVERFGQQEERSDYRAAVVATILGNVYREKGAKPIQIDSYYPRLSSWTKRKVKVMDAKAMLTTMAAAYRLPIQYGNAK